MNEANLGYGKGALRMDALFKLTEDWKQLLDRPRLVPFCMGRIGRRVLPSLQKEFDIPFLIDNYHAGETIAGLSVVSLADAVPRLSQDVAKIVVTTMKGGYDEITKDLQAAGFIEYRDFCIFERFAEEWHFRWKNECVLAKIDTVITSRCTLRCKNCNMFIPYAKETCDFPFERLKENFDAFFDSVDFVYEYTLLGGEPFLHTELPRILHYLMECYSERIGRINLISNGTVIPNGELLELMKQHNMTVHISDYTATVDYKKRLAAVEAALAAHGIEYYVIPNNVWKDVVYPRDGYCAAHPKEHMNTCGHSTHSVDDGKLYWCDPAFAAECFTGFPSRPDDFLDLRENQRTYGKEQSSLNIFRYLLGDVNARGYMSICQSCAGIGRDNENVVKAGVQMGKEDDSIDVR